ncbi:peptidoglycan editing factor PgeF [Altererythrobacter sp. CC-YST694]|uniref:peptidoglycan editing factor PgeF n=1 Tax=Altererythrobacter sp. CC-YST694 TaxID=2755038 RepID=UPI001D002DDF|nr:peptidoglycan editing factor PgeF [Altererythrobacter sp. CC-YST694]MCB5425288.1 peptidoglycan editing factor PgeF [Altererythrobacter sp. CC-YST694]
MADSQSVEVNRAAILADIPHGFLGRRGGVSTGLVAGLNVGFGADDDPAAVAENRRRAGDAVLPGAPLVAVHQVHSAICVTVEQPWDDDHRPTADALVTARPGTLIGIVTADCAPILFADREAGVIGAAHAGWRGAQGGVAEATIEAMETLGARCERIIAAIGPCIAQASYEVGEDFRAGFTAQDGEFFAPGRAGHYQFDLESYIATRLAAAGIRKVEGLALDTYAQEDRFFSFRRSTHRAEPNYGRQFSLIGLPFVA